LLGEVRFKSGYMYEGVEVGGLSGITYDPLEDAYYAITDDQSRKAPSRFYRLKINLDNADFTNGDVEFVGMTSILTPEGKPFAKKTIDAEGIVITPQRTLYISSEGRADAQIPPFVREFTLQGEHIASFNTPEKFLPNQTGDRGIRQNFGFESLTATFDNMYLFSASENALMQDGPQADTTTGSPSRIIKFDAESGQVLSEYLYWVEQVPHAPIPPDGFRINGLVELLAINDTLLLALERSFSGGVGNGLRLFEISLQGANDISKAENLKDLNPDKIRSVRKRLLLDFKELGIQLENTEGMTFGPRLADGRQSLVFASDNNFNKRQFTQFLLFAFKAANFPRRTFSDVKIAQIQGRSHTSKLWNDEVRNISGIVTATNNSDRSRGFWMQGGGDDAIATSDAIFVSTGDASPQVQIGDAVSINGIVEEKGFGTSLTVTQITNPTVLINSSDNALPTTTTLGAGGRVPPFAKIDDDAFASFDVETDAIDFFESLEGMRVQVNSAVVVGPTNRFGEFVVVADKDEGSEMRSANGGLLAQPGDFNPERILVNTMLLSNVPEVQVGDRFDGFITGVLHYSFGNFKIVATGSLPLLQPSNLKKETTDLRATEDALTVATFNVENLDFMDSEEKFASVANAIIKNLQSPDIVALQEVQDNNGPTDDGVVDAGQTLQRLIQKVVALGGPEYTFVQVNPENNADGGQPGGNIRVGYLFNPGRVEFERRGDAVATDGTQIVKNENEMQLSLNPGRLAPNHAAFEGNRKPLGVEFVFKGEKIFLVNNHLKSKRGDDGLFGSKQPPVANTETKRTEQVKVLVDFVEKLLAADANANIIVLGDMNEYQFRKPMQLLAESSLTNLIEKIPTEDRYTYIFQGSSQILDHIFVSRNLMRTNPKVDIVHINADFPNSQRASDHEPIVARFNLHN